MEPPKHQPAPPGIPPPIFTSLSPILAVEAIEPLLPFWTGRLGFTLAAQVPHRGALGFVILQQGSVRVMLQTRASILEDVEAVHAILEPGTPILFFGVRSIEETREALEGWGPVLVPLRETWYGAREIWVQSPEGAVVGFAEFRN